MEGSAIRTRIDQLVKEEMKQMQFPSIPEPELKHPWFHGNAHGLDLLRYSLKQPSDADPISAWKEAVKLAESVLEMQHHRNYLLELLEADYEILWDDYKKDLEALDTLVSREKFKQKDADEYEQMKLQSYDWDSHIYKDLERIKNI